MRTIAIVVSAALVALFAAGCGEKNVPTPRTSDAGLTSTAAVTSVPHAKPDRDTPPADTPATHTGTPQPDQTAAAAPTARDTPAMQPAAPLTSAEEQKSMPKPGQTDNHFTTSLEQSQKPAIAAPEPAKQ